MKTMLMINVGLSTPKAGRLISLFKKHADPDGNICYPGTIDSKQEEFLLGMCGEGFVCCFVSDWGNQEVSYCMTEIGKQITRTLLPISKIKK